MSRNIGFSPFTTTRISSKKASFLLRLTRAVRRIMGLLPNKTILLVNKT